MSSDLPPHDMMAESGLVSSAFQSPVKHLPLFISKVPPEAFYDLKNRHVWQALVKKYEAGDVIDLLTIERELSKVEKFENFGGYHWLAGLLDFAPSPEGISEYAMVVMEKFSQRKILQAIGSISSSISKGESHEIIRSKVESLISESSEQGSEIFSGEHCSSLMIDDLQRRFDLGGKLAGIDTGFHRMNVMTDGIQYAEQSIIGARPSMGKTAIGLNIFRNAVFELKIPSLFVSLEMSTAALMKRLLSAHMNIPMGDIRKGSYSKEDFAKFSIFKNICGSSPLYIVDATAGSSISDISSSIRECVRRHGVKLVVIDYLQKIKPSERQEKKTYEVGDISGRLKSLAVQTGAAFVTLAQLNRESEKDKGRIPRLSDLADSGQIERDGDTIMLIHRDKTNQSGETKIIIAKQRDGEVGMVDLIFNGRYCRFENPPIADSDVPINRHRVQL